MQLLAASGRMEDFLLEGELRRHFKPDFGSAFGITKDGKPLGEVHMLSELCSSHAYFLFVLFVEGQ